MLCWPRAAQLAVNVYVAAPLVFSATGDPSAALLSRNCTVPVGVPAEFPVTVAVSVTLLPVARLSVQGVPLAPEQAGEVVSAVLDTLVPVEPVPSGVTSFQSVARLLRSTEPHPVARSYPVVALYPMFPPF